ncbi:cysteine hydrolase family protein [Streptococcus sobrinus]|uniref:cysteine hydrolase family protein n=1 Tax=Streptococcus sobrinus TaxID=1310 RepID=UPI00030652CF|nr:isochorismatase family protein [Streptococcus sobrinus]
MSDYLLVIDMQDDYVGPGKLHSNPDLVGAINNKIVSYPQDRVVYIVNRFFWEFSRQEKKLIAPLLKVSNQVFEKRRASCFTNPELLKFLRDHQAQSLEFVGVDGNGCVKHSVLASAKLGFETTADLSTIGVANKKHFPKTKKKWEAAGVRITSD